MASTDTWAVLLSSSKFYYNYRHLGNVLKIYRLLRASGIENNKILLFNSLDAGCDARNVDHGTIYGYLDGRNSEISDMLTQSVEDFHGDEVTVENFLNVLKGVNFPSFSALKTLRSNENSTIIVYLSGHGGDEFFKLRDHEELSAQDLAEAISDMYKRKRYKRLLLIADTCQAATLAKYINVPGVVTIASSQKGENSFAFTTSTDIQVSLVDRFTLSLSKFLATIVSEPKRQGKILTFQDMMDSLDERFLMSSPSLTFSPESWQSPRDIDTQSFFGKPAKPKASITYTKPEVISSSSMFLSAPSHQIVKEVDFVAVKKNFSIESSGQHDMLLIITLILILIVIYL